ncbi:hypothetical protein LCGC14_1730460 [marine sediment metagenome]|uniref:Uncharacterized protein n=1 Tax=marine sediment metagenome TaxID=412755 RepID=A0A0F9JQC8_9ZZZZ
MPYIDPETRKEIDLLLEPLLKSGFLYVLGNVNYIISRVIHGFISEHNVCYSILNSAIGVLECAKLELYRIICTPYEDKKRAINGTISRLDEESGG